MGSAAAAAPSSHSNAAVASGGWSGNCMCKNGAFWFYCAVEPGGAHPP